MRHVDDTRITLSGCVDRWMRRLRAAVYSCRRVYSCHYLCLSLAWLRARFTPLLHVHVTVGDDRK
eukprot:4092252-Prymnesium_polylepis.2